MTKETNCALYSITDSLDYYKNVALSDKHILIKNGHLATKFYGQSELTVHDSQGPLLTDGKWHQVEAIQVSGSKCVFRVDGKQVGEHPLKIIDLNDYLVKGNDSM